jgi:hypothetical protein
MLIIGFFVSNVRNETNKNHSGCVKDCTRSLRLNVGPYPLRKLSTERAVMSASSLIQADRTNSETASPKSASKSSLGLKWLKEWSAKFMKVKEETFKDTMGLIVP